MKKILSIILVSFVLIFSIPLAFAQESDNGNYKNPEVTAPTIPRPDKLIGPEDSSKISETRNYVWRLVVALTQGFLSIVAAFAVVMLIISGIMYMVAFGDEEKLGAAKKAATFAVVGLLVALFAYGIVSIISTLSLPSPRIEETDQGDGTASGS